MIRIIRMVASVEVRRNPNLGIRKAMTQRLPTSQRTRFRATGFSQNFPVSLFSEA